MKKLIPFAMLATLVACNGGDGSSKPNFEKSIQKYESTLIVERGTVSNVITSGSELSIDLSEVKLSTNPINKKEKSIIIKVDGDDVYTYSEETDLLNNETTRKVTLEIMNPQKELLEVLNKKMGSIVGDNLVMKGSDSSNSEMSESIEIGTRYTFNAVVNLLKPMCEGNSQVVSKASLFENGKLKNSVSASQNEVSTCGTKLTDSQIKKIDLTDVEFCDESNEEESNCESNKDMSHLTADIT